MSHRRMDESSQLPATIAALPSYLAKAYGDRAAQRFYSDGDWQDCSFSDLAEIAEEIALGLIEKGIDSGDRVCVLADTCPEWIHIQLGIALAGAIVVPIYPSSSGAECQWVIENSGAKAVFYGGHDQHEKLSTVGKYTATPRQLIALESMSRATRDDDSADQPRGHDSLTLTELRRIGRSRREDEFSLPRRGHRIEHDDPALIVYTSGTTGKPKGCVLTNRNLLTAAVVCVDLELINCSDVVYLFLPLAHVFAQVISIAAMSIGAVVAYSSAAGTAALASDLQSVSPTVLPAVPRVFEKLHSAVCASMPESERRRAAEVGVAMRKDSDPTVLDEFLHFEQNYFSKLRAMLGGRVRLAITGAAPISLEVLEFFHGAGVSVSEGYGMTESTALGTLNSAGVYRLGSIGQPVPGCEVRLGDDEEILLRGPNVFLGYWRDPQATRATFVDGWLKTGDLGAIDADGFVTITGRKKDIVITAGGKNLAPAGIENDLRGIPWISQALLHADRRPYAVALITLDRDQVESWAREHGLQPDFDILRMDPRVHARLQEAIDAVNARHSRVERIKRFAVLDRDFTIEGGELTPTLKLKRSVIEERYRSILDGLYTTR